jgi:hypothetical protein
MHQRLGVCCFVLHVVIPAIITMLSSPSQQEIGAQYIGETHTDMEEEPKGQEAKERARGHAAAPREKSQSRQTAARQGAATRLSLRLHLETSRVPLQQL